MRKFRGQEYDGAANMSGAYGGIQAVAYQGGSGGDSPRAALWWRAAKKEKEKKEKQEKGEERKRKKERKRKYGRNM